VVFALIHLAVLLAVLGWAVLSLIQGNWGRALLIAVCLATYYFLALHGEVKKEVARHRQKRS